MHIGKTQHSVLRCLAERGVWHRNGAGCGWVWSTHSQTQRIMESLVNKGLVTRNEKGVYRVSAAGIEKLQESKQ